MGFSNFCAKVGSYIGSMAMRHLLSYITTYIFRKQKLWAFQWYIFQQENIRWTSRNPALKTSNFAIFQLGCRLAWKIILLESPGYPLFEYVYCFLSNQTPHCQRSWKYDWLLRFFCPQRHISFRLLPMLLFWSVAFNANSKHKQTRYILIRDEIIFLTVCLWTSLGKY